MSTKETVVERPRVADQVYQQLRWAVLERELTPGSRLSVPRLAARYGVSRSPVREAVQRLVRDGLAHDVPQRGCVVATVTVADLIPLYEVREMLEGLAARLAAERATRDEVAQLHVGLRSHEQAIASGDVRGHVEHDLAFHALLREAAGNVELKAALDRIQDKVVIALLSADHANWPAKAAAEHRAILDAIITADPNAAEAAARAHIARIRNDIATQGQQQEEEIRDGH